MEKGAVVADDRRFAEDNARGVVDHNPLAHDASGVYVHAEDFGHAALDGQRKRLPVLLPQYVSDAARLQSEVAPVRVEKERRVLGRKAGATR